MTFRPVVGSQVEHQRQRSNEPDVCVLGRALPAGAFDPANLRIFRRRYPKGLNLVVARDVTEPYTRQFGSLAVRFAGIEALGNGAGGAPGILP